ncbi:7TM diverse intracellular signaling domain-containing protein [Sulfurospirillum arcachonense]|uniref:7TM diverse intracellular signaling domain-containing protein n=1 Tax=Sulfurospirillum arcachonense TaxID=57666 RepID=UPI0004AC6E80|nr:7TM diverse intracellular signaling domain-containing protein [Sulfurospirillum arcachonense]
MKNLNTNTVISNDFSYGYTNEKYSFEIEAQNTTNEPIEYYLQFAATSMERVDFSFDNRIFKSGLEVDVKDRQIKNIFPTVRVKFAPHEKKSIKIDLQTRLPMHGKFTFFDTESYYAQGSKMQSMYMVYYGAVGVMFLYNLFLFLSLRDKNYFYYVMYVFSMFMTVLTFSGDISLILPYAVYYLSYIFFISFFAFLSLFAYNILRIKEIYPKSKILIYLNNVILLLFAINVLTDMSAFKYYNNYLLFESLGLLVLGGIAIYKNVQGAKLYFAAFSIFILSYVITGAVAAGLLPYTFFTKHIFLLGSIIEITLFSILLASKINSLQEENLALQVDESNRLSRMVNEKTKTLSDMVKEREVLLKEIHHRVKNNLQVIHGLLGIQSMKSNNTQAQGMLQNIMGRIRSIAFVHEHLYSKDSVENIDAKEYLEQLIQSIGEGVLDDIDLQSQIESFTIDLDAASNIGIIISEVIFNSLKHAFKDEQKDKTILVSMSKDEKKIVLVVKDNGIGFDGETKETDSLGIKIIHSIISKDKKSHYMYEKDKGTKFTLEYVL